MLHKDKIAVLDFGGQYAHLIANRIRRLGVYSEIMDPESETSQLNDFAGIIFSGGPHSVYEKNAPLFNKKILEMGKPVLGICYGHQLVSYALGGEVKPGKVREFGRAEITISESPIFKGISPKNVVWMSHGDSVAKFPEGFKGIASTSDCPVAAVEHSAKKIYGFQFHPEVTHSAEGMKMMSNFLEICGCSKSWDMKSYTNAIGEEIRTKVGNRNVFLLVSGGVDSVVAFALLNKVLTDKRVLGLHIDNGLMRKDETASVMDYMKKHNFTNLNVVDASGKFLSRLEGVHEPEKKRKIIGDTFIDVQREALDNLKLDPEKWILGQGTIYPDTIESGSTKHAAVIKTHHNRVPIIEQMIKEGRVIEPLAELYKDEVRDLGRELGLPEELIERHPFPGPGLGVRLLCSDGTLIAPAEDDSAKAVALTKEQGYNAYVLPIRSVGVQGDFRTYAQPLAVEGNLEWNALSNLSTTITNAVRSINRVVLVLKRRNTLQPELYKAYTTADRLHLLREADAIVTDFLHKEKLYSSIWQMPVVLLPVGNGSEKDSLVLRPVSSSEAMTADFFKIPEKALTSLAEKLIVLPGLSAVMYDLTNKPPATIEWE
ncbi:MAG: glutamine-hydrolyzing GMP synthase [Fibrobacteres bacterium]|nr:glutamine-hydrolyzing GMP synthase [Fibrobacterota bacterium]